VRAVVISYHILLQIPGNLIGQSAAEGDAESLAAELACSDRALETLERVAGLPPAVVAIVLSLAGLHPLAKDEVRGIGSVPLLDAFRCSDRADSV
jgi:hypothetical protein